MKFNITLFAGVKELIGKPVVTIDWSGADLPTIADLKTELVCQYPAAAALLTGSLLAVDCHYASDDCTVSPAQELALIPPVSGG